VLSYEVFDLEEFAGPRGTLRVGEFARRRGAFRRFYFITGVPPGERRGGHAHKTQAKYLVCVQGSVEAHVESQGRADVVPLAQPGRTLYLPAGYWLDLMNFSPDAVLAVLADQPYDEADYIRDRVDFHRWERRDEHASRVAYVNFDRLAKRHGDEIRAALSRVVDSGTYIGGDEVEAFEREFAAYCGTKHAVGVGSGLSALELTLRAWGLGPDDEVIVPANTAVPTALAVTHAGARLVLADVEPSTGLVDPDAIEAALTPATRAIIPVHLYGHPAEMDRIRAIAARAGVKVLEDAAQAHGATYRGARCGALADAAAFSFYPTKNLGALGDGGCVTTNDGELARTLRSLRNAGSTVKYVHDEKGTTSRLGPMQAAVLRVKLPYLDGWNRRRGELAALYAEALGGTAGLTLPALAPSTVSAWHAFPVLVHDGIRDAVRRALLDDGIGTNVHYPVPVHLQPCYADLGARPGDFPVSERRAEMLLSLPLDPFHTDGEIRRVAASLRAALERLREPGLRALDTAAS
jgi:dTDP-3-amino-3,4,6-trideoxy-alpha-D-glucose transaminase